MANRTIRTPEKEQLVLRELRTSGHVAKACSRAKIGKTTWYDWKDDDPELQAAHTEAMAIGRENKADRAEDKLGDRIEAGDTTAIIFALKTLRREVYGDRSIHELTGPDGQPLTVLFSPRPDGPA